MAGSSSPAEDAWAAAVERICDEQQIDVVFPSWDPYVLAASKHARRLAERGVTVPVPPFDAAIAAFDKYKAVEAGLAVGFPCPRTYLFESAAQLADIAARESFPLVVKPRFTAGGRGMVIACDREQLLRAVPRVAASFGNPMIQEYIPGGERDSVQFVVDRDGRFVFCFQKRRIRTFRRTARFGTVSESVRPDARVRSSAALVGRSGWWGAMGIETIRDPRDGEDKLMEINPRFPRQLWNRTQLGINEPLMCIRIARGERVDPVDPCPPGILFVSPVEDAGLLALQWLDLAVYRWRTRVRGRAPIDGLCEPLSVRRQWQSFARTYSSDQPRVWDPYFRHALTDPVTAVLWWLQFGTWLAGGFRHLGR
jgi:glutathione synthase/RimK-type ligase-like ATP-grasp enzyme